MGLKILCRVYTHIFFNYFFFWKKYMFMHFERPLYIFSRKPENILGFTSEFK